MLSMRSKYALKALSCLARHRDTGPISITELAEAENIPKKFLESILLTLKSQGMLSSKKGPGGGYWLTRHPSSLTIGSVVRVFDGDLAPVQCLSESSQGGCPECADRATCGVRLVMLDLFTAILSVLDSVTLTDMIERSESEQLKRSHQLNFVI
jgi:Rrf2 family protein